MRTRWQTVCCNRAVATTHTEVRMKLSLSALVLVGLVAAGAKPADAFPIANTGEGLKVFVTGTNPIVATYEGNSASYSNDLYLMLDGTGQPGDDGITSNDLFIFNNHASAVGATKDLGSFALGTELEFRLFVNNTGNTFFTGPGARNPDNHAHARVQAD